MIGLIACWPSRGLDRAGRRRSVGVLQVHDFGGYEGARVARSTLPAPEQRIYGRAARRFSTPWRGRAVVLQGKMSRTLFRIGVPNSEDGLVVPRLCPICGRSVPDLWPVCARSVAGLCPICGRSVPGCGLVVDWTQSDPRTDADHGMEDRGIGDGAGFQRGGRLFFQGTPLPTGCGSPGGCLTKSPVRP